MCSATPASAATTRRRRVCPASSAARRRCRRIEHCVATVTSWMPAPAFSRDRTVARHPAPAASPGPCAALSVESPRLPFFDGSRHKASPPANWFNQAPPRAAAKRQSDAPKRELAPGRITPRDRRRGAPRAAGTNEHALRRSGAAGVGFVQHRGAKCRRTVAPPCTRSDNRYATSRRRRRLAFARKRPDATSARSSPCRIPSS